MNNMSIILQYGRHSETWKRLKNTTNPFINVHEVSPGLLGVYLAICVRIKFCVQFKVKNCKTLITIP